MNTRMYHMFMSVHLREKAEWRKAFGLTERNPGKVCEKLVRAASAVGGIRELGWGGARFPIASMLF